MKHNRLFNAVYRQCHRRNYNQAIRLLEPRLSYYLQDSQFLALLSRLYLLTGDVDNAEIYARRGLRANESDLDLLLLQAVIHLKHRETAKSLQGWLRVLEDHRWHRYARLGLRYLRRYSEPGQLAEFCASKKIWRLLPSLPGLKSWRRRRFWVWTGWLLLPLAALVLVLLYRFENGPLKASVPEREGVEVFTNLPQSFTEASAATVSETVLAESAERIQTYYRNYRDNAVRFEINVLKQNKLPLEYRNWLLLLEPLLRAPEIHTLKDNFSYQEVSRAPELYQNCFVRWRGRVTNVVKQPTQIGFDLLVDYLDGDTFSGPVSVWIGTAAPLRANQLLEVLGEIRVNAQGFYLQAKTLRRLEE